MNESWLERYNKAQTWHEKCTIMALYHSTMHLNFAHRWTLKDTAEYFSVSIGLVSENIKLAQAIDDDNSIVKCLTRQKALDKIK